MPVSNPAPRRLQPARTSRDQKVTTGIAQAGGRGQPHPPLTHDLTKPAGATAQLVKPEPNPT